MTDGPVERCYFIIGRNVRAARRARGYTQDDLALLLGITRNSVARIEMGHQRLMLHTIPKIARWLGLLAPPDHQGDVAVMVRVAGFEPAALTSQT